MKEEENIIIYTSSFDDRTFRHEMIETLVFNGLLLAELKNYKDGFVAL
ncbi:MAG: hypothetical protein NE334_13785 [Lentisphaeraceae bacterium]|nr:hypothetical protein [Lentisphaeraceae bacterium]